MRRSCALPGRAGGRVACVLLGSVPTSATAAALAAAVQDSPVVIGVADGDVRQVFGRIEEVWRSVLDGYYERRWVFEGTYARMATDPGSDTWHTGLGIGRGGDGKIVITSHEGGPPMPEGVIERWMLDAATGRQLDRTVASRRETFITIRSGAECSYVDRPFPAVHIRPGRPCARGQEPTPRARRSPRRRASDPPNVE